jgi:hypothetical protein
MKYPSIDGNLHLKYPSMLLKYPIHLKYPNMLLKYPNIVGNLHWMYYVITHNTPSAATGLASFVMCTVQPLLYVEST